MSVEKIGYVDFSGLSEEELLEATEKLRQARYVIAKEQASSTRKRTPASTTERKKGKREKVDRSAFVMEL